MKNKSLLIHRTRSGAICIVDPGSLPDADSSEPIVLIAEAIINAGFTGLEIDSLELASGQHYEVLSADFDTLEGQLLQLLDQLDPSAWPTPEQAVQIIRAAYQFDEKDPQ